MPEAMPALSEEKNIPIDDTGDSVDVELQADQLSDQQEETQVQEQPTEEPSEHDEYSAGVKKRINDLTKKWRS